MVAAVEWTERHDNITITDAKPDTFGASTMWRRSLAGEKPTDLRILGHHL